MKKNFLAVILAFILALALTACGSSSGTATLENAGAAGTEAESSATTPEETEETEEAGEVFLEAFDTTPTLAETVLWEEQGVKVTATGLTYTDWDAELNLAIENTGTEDFTFLLGSAGYYWNAINGFMTDDGYLNVDVAAGETVEDCVSFDTEALQYYGINRIATITVAAMLEDGDYNYTMLAPQELETTAAATYDFDADPFLEAVNSGVLAQRTGFSLDYHATDEVFSSNGIAIVSETLMGETVGSNVGLLLEIQNQSDNHISYEITDFSVNGESLYNGIWSLNSVNPDASYIQAINLSNMVERFYEPEEGEPEDLIADGVRSVAFTFSVLNDDGDLALTPQEISLQFV